MALFDIKTNNYAINGTITKSNLSLMVMNTPVLGPKMLARLDYFCCVCHHAFSKTPWPERLWQNIYIGALKYAILGNQNVDPTKLFFLREFPCFFKKIPTGLKD